MNYLVNRIPSPLPRKSPGNPVHFPARGVMRLVADPRDPVMTASARIRHPPMQFILFVSSNTVYSDDGIVRVGAISLEFVAIRRECQPRCDPATAAIHCGSGSMTVEDGYAFGGSPVCTFVAALLNTRVNIMLRSICLRATSTSVCATSK